jgi:periplasmic divalent cation tolerance protein
MSVCLLYTTTATHSEATALAHALLTEKHIACANILSPTTSMYVWEGALQQTEEMAILFKTTQSRKTIAMERITELHPYDCPCIIELVTDAVHPPFAKWIFSQIGD